MVAWDWRSRSYWNRYRVGAWFPSMERAREAISSLGASGIEAANISLLGRPASQAVAEADVRETDARVTEFVSRRAAIGAIAGVAGGCFSGFLVGGMALAAAGQEPLGPGIWITMVCGGVLGGVVGGLIGGESALDMAEGWELTFHPVEEGSVLVSVHSDYKQDVDRATEILETKEPLSLERNGGAAKVLDIVVAKAKQMTSDGDNE